MITLCEFNHNCSIKYFQKRKPAHSYHLRRISTKTLFIYKTSSTQESELIFYQWNHRDTRARLRINY